jgi:hypothetical protein
LSVVESFLGIAGAVPFAPSVLLVLFLGHALFQIERRHCGAGRGHGSTLVACRSGVGLLSGRQWSAGMCGSSGCSGWKLSASLGISGGVDGL